MSALFLITNNLSYLTNPVFLLDIQAQYFVIFYYLSQAPRTKHHHSSRNLSLTMPTSKPTNTPTTLNSLTITSKL